LHAKSQSNYFYPMHSFLISKCRVMQFICHVISIPTIRQWHWGECIAVCICNVWTHMYAGCICMCACVYVHIVRNYNDYLWVICWTMINSQMGCGKLVNNESVSQRTHGICVMSLCGVITNLADYVIFEIWCAHIPPCPILLDQHQ